jgi:hypothetical protein
MIGEKFGKLTVVYFNDLNKRKEKLWLCLCDCGKEIIVKTRNLKIGATKSCGCLSTGPKISDLTGNKFGDLEVISYAHQDKWRTSFWNCRCICGNYTVASSANLKSGNRISCGCKHDEWKHNKPKGQDSPHWNSDIIDRNSRRLDYEAKDWAIRIKERDKYKCLVCGKSPSGELTSHHLYSYNDYIDLRYDIDNGITLCEQCHYSFHKKYGFKKNTKEQFKEWKNELYGSNSTVEECPCSSECRPD